MVDRDYGNIGVALSSIIGAIALFFGVPEVKAFGGVLIGAAVTYFVQTQLQNQAEKNKIRKQNMEETLIPVLLTLRDIKRNLETASLLNAQENWRQYTQDYRRFIFTEEFFGELDGLFKDFSDYRTKLVTLRQDFLPKINELFESHFFNKIESQLKLVRSLHLYCFHIFWNDYYYDEVPIDNPLILDYDPFIVYKRKYENFDIRNLEIVADVYAYDADGNQSGKTEHKIQSSNHLDLFSEFISAVKEELDERKDVEDLRTSNRELITSVDKSITKLENYITKHYPVESIR